MLSFDDAENMYTYLHDEDYPEGKKVLEIVRNFLVNANSRVHKCTSILEGYEAET